MYADSRTPAMDWAITETERRRAKQQAFNEKNGIVPRTIVKSVRELIEISRSAEDGETKSGVRMTARERKEAIEKLEKEMKKASRMLEFEYAAVLRDRIIKLRGEKTSEE
jgi:excinuclease ABC subunit B